MFVTDGRKNSVRKNPIPHTGAFSSSARPSASSSPAGTPIAAYAAVLPRLR